MARWVDFARSTLNGLEARRALPAGQRRTGVSNRWTLLLVAAVAACSSLSSEPGGVVALEVVIPDTTILSNGSALQLQARARDLQGNLVPGADIRWQTPDTLLIALDSLTGLVTAISDTGAARVQASVGTLRSDVLTITLRAPAGTDTSTTGRRARP